MSEIIEGGCACGDVRYKLQIPPLFVHCCHCRECQTHSGSAFVINALVETDRIDHFSGELVAISVPTNSGGPHDIYHCVRCQTALWSDYGRRAGMRFLRVGTLDDPAKLPPDVHIFTRSKLPWVTLPEDVPAFRVYYDMKEVWPADRLARRHAIKK
ncbi:GFA family protein [Sneathiella sp. HT1-7]|uniref:GFA family protein n=1 Tax=Sneathiella sp. HT1-7 TaxID=2887192 RepID=UPI001D13FDCD|nr:GFA family protein [Sneathiella sp. HT1-7]MCC3304940.1 GFA family protein [Sneathiella sp. HT1-7]